MAAAESSDSSSASLAIKKYSDGPPWVFKGRALYQLHAVKSSVARRFIPPELKLVEAFGYTLGGFFLAHYDGSPAGEFDEAVVIAGIVWNAPTSCAWAGRVLVGSEEARIHGRQEVGLPSHFASFSHKVRHFAGPDTSPARPWWDARSWFSGGARRQALKAQRLVEIVQRDGISTPLCQIVGLPRLLSSHVSSESTGKREQRWRGPSVQLYLPNFSGKTKEQPNLLKYSCALNCRVSVVAPARVADTASTALSSKEGENVEEVDKTRDVIAILTGKPLASIFFNQMVMHVEAPSVLDLEEAKKKRKQKKAMEPTGNVGTVLPGAASASRASAS